MGTESSTKQQELAELESRVSRLQQEIAEEAAGEPFQPTGFYTGYYATAGFMLGMFAALASLMFNVVGSLFVGQHPLQLIRVYLTFPLGDRAMEIDTGLALAIGCCLYLGTGMLLGVIFQVVLARLTPEGPVSSQLVVASVLAILVWIVNYYAVLSWLQPATIEMSEANYIINQVPWWVGMLTHLVFGWTMVLLYPFGKFVPYRRPTTTSPS